MISSSSVFIVLDKRTVSAIIQCASDLAIIACTVRHNNSMQIANWNEYESQQH